MRRGQHKCPFCKTLFRPHPSAAQRQYCCSKPECQRARKAENNRAFRAANPDYWQGAYQVNRTRRWRQKHPGYWRNEKRNGGAGRSGSRRSAAGDGSALQVELLPQVPDPRLVELQNEVTALQAVSQWHVTVLEGLASQLTGCALQAEVGSILNGWYDRGSRVGGALASPRKPLQDKEPDADESPATSPTGTAPPGAGKLQLG